MPNCARYYKLRLSWEFYELCLRANPGSRDARGNRDQALLQLRAHAEICEECIAALFAPFAETVGKAKIMLSIGDIAS